MFFVEKYIEKCLKSIKNQTYSKFEVILVDDGSTDNSVEKIMQFANQDARFNVISQQNLGVGIARNNALKQAKGQYIVFVDPDDWIETQALEKLLGAFSSENAEVVEFNYNECNDLSGKIKLHDNALLMKKRFFRDLHYLKYYNLAVIKEKCFCGVDMHIWTRAYSAEILHRINAKFSALRLAEDHIYKKVCRKVLSFCDYLRMRFKTKTYKSFLEMLFSIKNERRLCIKRKVINIIGISFKI